MRFLFEITAESISAQYLQRPEKDEPAETLPELLFILRTELAERVQIDTYG